MLSYERKKINLFYFRLKNTVMISTIVCSISNCSIVETQVLSDRMISLILQLVFAIIGVFLNFLSFYKLLSKKFFNKINKNFFDYIRLHTFNCLIVNLNDIVVLLFFFIGHKTVFVYQMTYMYRKEMFVYYYAFFYLPVWVLTYSFSGAINIFIILERIQLINFKFNFLRNIPPWFCSILVFIYSVIINIPVSISREVFSQKLSIENDKTNITELFILKASGNVGNGEILQYIIYSCNFIRDIVTSVVTIFINIYLIVLIKLFMMKKMRFRRRNLPSNGCSLNMNLSVKEIKNKVIALVICFLSIFNSLFIYSLTVAFFNNWYNYIYYALILVGCVHNFTHSLNFFILFFFNQLFRNEFSKYFVTIQNLSFSSFLTDKNSISPEENMEIATYNKNVMLVKFKKI